jgi:U4/U6 small nuclear ribonucleoprotein PRP31
LKEEISKKMIKIQEPKQARIIKPLPKPDDKPRRKRGGKRLRSQKQIYMMTELRQMKNRMKFGEEAEVEYRGTGKGFGIIGVGGNGSKLKVSTKQQKINTKKQKQVNIHNTKEAQKSG